MPIRNLFARRPDTSANSDSSASDYDEGPLGFERVSTVGSKASSALSIRSSKSQDNGEYKMSVVNDSGVYLPPSPPEERAQWPRKYLSSRASTDTRSSIGDIEHFSISRESFDSYRRSFDITARSPIPNGDITARQSLDSARFPHLKRPAVDRRLEKQPPTPEESFEDVGLEDHKQLPRKRGFFSKSDKDAPNQPVVSRLLAGRKRGQSGQGAELGNMEQARMAVKAE